MPHCTYTPLNSENPNCYVLGISDIDEGFYPLDGVALTEHDLTMELDGNRDWVLNFLAFKAFGVARYHGLHVI